MPFRIWCGDTSQLVRYRFVRLVEPPRDSVFLGYPFKLGEGFVDIILDVFSIETEVLSSSVCPDESYVPS